MQIITAFEERFGEEEGPALLKEYGLVFDAMLFEGWTVAENVLARTAKKQLRLALPEGKLIDEPPEQWWEGNPLHVTTKSVSMTIFQLPASTEAKARHYDRWAEWVAGAVEALIRDIEGSWDRKQNLEMIGPLNTRVTQVGNDLFKFEFKQKWVTHGP